MLWLLVACVPPTPVVGPIPVDVALVPGCPTEADGALSDCQWRRVAWAQHLYAIGAVDRLIVSGAAVQNRYVEADAMKLGLVALGVPAERVLTEPQALHTDQNVAFALDLVDAHPDWRFAVASDPLQAPGCCDMVRAWSGRECAVLAMDMPLVDLRVRLGMPEVKAEPVPAAHWLPLDERERRIAALTGHRRGNSMLIYASKALLNGFGLSHRPPLPPPIEALLASR